LISEHQTKFRLYTHFSLRSGNFAWCWLATFTESIPKTQDIIVYKAEHCINTGNNDIKASKEIGSEGNTVTNNQKNENLGCDTMWWSGRSQMFLLNILFPSSGSRISQE
jgi:hypothetical protein